MVLCGEGDCSVCLLAFSRAERVPRLLHCRHTFCQPCLETLMTRARNGLLTVGCPLCRRVTCIRPGLSLQEALWVNSGLWEQIPEDDNVLKDEANNHKTEASFQGACQAECIPRRKRVKFGIFFWRKLRLTRRSPERMVASSNVEMKSWRRLSSEDDEKHSSLGCGGR
ncbi:uncharacterized protein im:7152348 [Dunckerocampus dactyliophorus]|uniref:uncharacterized protein im:7152348 n=1 Tax=Dunckerocampus dactyliophorus TaxID=161453 RepID=UPI002406267F|nr:uncharacterized protein im:7152348 [Dunckerocampus dactyliophorus]